ncbi:MAG TPA: hypothetical protein VJT49_27445 [Amycolatopsis sp.]|uniref:hypothetical protein n=1 Tax=Amycolatopsis sp. TaxID=37632 RepID=UPI002B4625A5|nr:hypothetical protein [Amycolatopsis sp.]HKS48777.1 hypothetical protein [Amycolatopsis sp.]
MTSPVLNTERQFLGCLMRLPTDPARRVLAGMRPTDLANPTAAFVLHLAIRALADNVPPAPAVLFEHAHEIAERPRTARLQQVGLWIVDTYQQAPLAPEQHTLYLKAAVLKAAWRRAVAEHAQRLLQAAAESSTDELRELTDDTSTADELWSRYQAARNHNSVSARLEVAA